MDPETPLVVTEVNIDKISDHKGIIANPNCSTILLLVPLWPLHREARVLRARVATYQAVSGAGARALEELETQTRDVIAGRPAQPKVLPHRIAFNLFSHNSKIGPAGYNEEETKMAKETHKIFSDPTIGIAATCVRVPIHRAHSEAVYIETPTGELWVEGQAGVRNYVRIFEYLVENAVPARDNVRVIDAAMRRRARQPAGIGTGGYGWVDLGEVEPQ